MMTAKEAREKCLIERFKDINAEEQYNDICNLISKKVSLGAYGLSYYTEIHPEVIKKLNDLGYEIVDGGLNSHLCRYDKINW